VSTQHSPLPTQEEPSTQITLEPNSIKSSGQAHVTANDPISDGHSSNPKPHVEDVEMALESPEDEEDQQEVTDSPEQQSTSSAGAVVIPVASPPLDLADDIAMDRDEGSQPPAADNSRQASTSTSSQSQHDSHETSPIEITGLQISGSRTRPALAQSPQELASPLVHLPMASETRDSAGQRAVTDLSLKALDGEVVVSKSVESRLLTYTQAGDDTRLPLPDLLDYRSPLEYFRAYRFHPKYFDVVPGGLKSLTYSSKIDPDKFVCPHALTDEPCPDRPACPYQHFEDMVLPGESPMLIQNQIRWPLF
jgi:hypothetical protein